MKNPQYHWNILNSLTAQEMERNNDNSSVKDRVKKVKMVVFDFDGVFTDNRVIVFEDGREAAICSRFDGFGLSAIQKIGINVLVLSYEQNPIVLERCKKLKIDCINNCHDKLTTLKRESANRDIPLENIAYMGNDINDIECMEAVGLPVCVADSHPDVLPKAKYVTSKNGGYGAVREFCDLIVNTLNNNW